MTVDMFKPFQHLKRVGITCLPHKQVATVRVATVRSAAAAQIDPSHSPGGASAYSRLIQGSSDPREAAPAKRPSRSVQPFSQGSWL